MTIWIKQAEVNGDKVFPLLWSEGPNLLVGPKAAVNVVFAIINWQLEDMVAVLPLSAPDPAGNPANRPA